MLVVDPPLLRVWRMTTGRVLSKRLTLTGMTPSGQSWPPSGTSTPWKSLQESRRLSASIYELVSETSPAFHLPVSPLVRLLLDDTNLVLSKFLEDQTVHGFLPMPGHRHRKYYCTSSSSFPGPYSVQASEARKRSVSLSASQVASLETMLSGVCEVSSWLDWWLSTCGGFREYLPNEVRADF